MRQFPDFSTENHEKMRRERAKKTEIDDGAATDRERERREREREEGKKEKEKKADRGLSLEAAGSECNPSLTLGPREPRVRHFHPQNGSKEQKKSFK